MRLSQTQILELEFYEALGRLLVSTHKTLLAMVCRNLHSQLRALGVTLSRNKYTTLVQPLT